MNKTLSTSLIINIMIVSLFLGNTLTITKGRENIPDVKQGLENIPDVKQGLENIPDVR